MRRPLRDRFAEKVRVDLDTGCWEWTAHRNGKGYGVIWENGTKSAHRVAWMLLVGPIAEGLTIDHAVCQNKGCVNPAHMELVTARENTSRSFAYRTRKFECANGHQYTPENTGRISTTGARYCRTCARASTRSWRAANREKATA